MIIFFTAGLSERYSCFNLPDTVQNYRKVWLYLTLAIWIYNKRLWNTRILFSQIILLEKLEKGLCQRFPKDRVTTHINSLKKQQITNALSSKEQKLR